MKKFNIILPESWVELTDTQLLMVFRLFASDLSAAEVKTLCMMKWGRLKVLASLPMKRFLIKRGKEVVLLRLKIWQEQITLLGVIDTGHLLNSVKALPVRADGRFIVIGLSQLFTEYGLWQDFGTGKEILAENIGQEFTGIVAQSLDDNYRRYNH